MNALKKEKKVDGPRVGEKSLLRATRAEKKISLISFFFLGARDNLLRATKGRPLRKPCPLRFFGSAPLRRGTICVCYVSPFFEPK